MASNSERSLSVSVSISETSRFRKRVVRTELRDESVMEEEECERFATESVEAKAPDVLVGGGVGSGGDDGGGENWFGDGYGDSGRGNGSMEEY